MDTVWCYPLSVPQYSPNAHPGAFPAVSRRRTAVAPRRGPRREGPGQKLRRDARARRRPGTSTSPARSAAGSCRRGASRSRPAPGRASPPRPTPRPRPPLPGPRPSTGLSLWPYRLSSSQRDPGGVAPGSSSVYTSREGASAPASGGGYRVSDLLLITGALEPSAEVLPALGLLLHPVRVLPADASALVEAPPADVILVDARRDLAHAKSICRLLYTTGLDCPLFAIVTEGGLAAINAEWGADDVILHTAGPAEVEAGFRLAIGRRAVAAEADAPDEIRSGELAIDEATYAARLRGRVLDLTFKEFELLKFLAQHPGRVFTRAQLLQEVWGYDYFGGTRTVDVHVRRLRAKLGSEHEALIGTVRNVGYRFVPVKGERAAADERVEAVATPAQPARTAPASR